MRIVALSDQHGHLPAIPPCDLVIIAGDVCPDRVGPFLAARDHPDQQKVWFNRNVRPWLARAAAAHTILTWGNHDWCGQACSFRHDSPAAASTTGLQILVDTATTVPVGPGGDAVTVWATPWSSQFMDWAFMKPPADLERIYAQIPEQIDILVSHQPPYGFGDRYRHQPSGRAEHLGSRELLAAIDRIRPKLVICGHIHDGHGRFDYDGVPIYNVSILDEQYRLVHEPTVIDFPVRTPEPTACSTGEESAG
jgi:hypothetical protein